MKRILLPTDFSDNAWSAAVYALKLYADEVCMFYFLNSTYLNTIKPGEYATGEYIKELRSNALKLLLEMKEQAEVSNANSNHSFDIILSNKGLNTAIDTSIKTHEIDVVVMGTKGASGANKLLFGSNTLNAISKIKTCPILVIPDEFDFVIPKQIAFSTDFNRFYSHLELDPLKDMAYLYNSKIRIVHVNTEEQLNGVQEYNVESLKKHLEDYEFTLHWMPDYANLTEEINVFIEDLNIDMLAMVNYRHNFFEYFFKEPVIKNLVKHPRIPFLVIPNKESE